MRHILLVEEDRERVAMARDALSRERVLNTVHNVPDGASALAFLRREGVYAEAPRPHVILCNGLEPGHPENSLIAEIKQDHKLRTIPLAVLTASETDQDVWAAYQQHANCYVVKPKESAAYQEAVTAVSRFWLSVAVLPPDDAGAR
ncbi:MAG: hypothetical protein A2516_04120 [Alphaproteobacteria bacterium RIFOXYD12_FULL_60_8]|nr:MAG: hypothetical protein A2516_04120 [Alphaproteobacteria bacterium RIFOXYD12_FULL_60_8]